MDVRTGSALGKAIGFFIGFFIRGVGQIALFPVVLYRIKKEGLRPHWATWLGYAVLMYYGVWGSIKIYRQHAMWPIQLVVATLFAAGFFAFSEWAIRQRGWLAWCPGLRGDNLTGAPIGAQSVVRGTTIISADQARAETAKWADDLNIRFDGVAWPFELENNHLLVSGRTGAGKTVAINDIVSVARHRGNPLLVADPGAGYLARFGNANDAILNPFDARSVQWSPFAEIRSAFDCERIAKAAVPDGEGDAKEWHSYAQTFLSETLRSCWHAGQTSTKDLMWWLTTATREDLQTLLGQSPAAILCDKGNAKMLSNTRGIIATYLNAWQYLPETGDFSVRAWMQAAAVGAASGLFITYRDDQLGALRNLIATWVELAVIEGLSLPVDEKRRIWVVLDELDALGKITALRDGLTRLRKYGVPVVAGLQTVAQLRSTYGADFAQVLFSCLSSKLVLGAGDAETGAAMSRELGDAEVVKESENDGRSRRFADVGTTNNSGTSRSQHIEAAVLPSEITGLPALAGYLKVPGWPVVRLALKPTTYPAQIPDYIERTEPLYGAVQGESDAVHA